MRRIDDTFSDILKFRLIETDSQSQKTFHIIDQWLKICLETHDEFCTNTTHPLQTRVLFLGAKDSNEHPYLVDTEGEPGKWVALSHC